MPKVVPEYKDEARQKIIEAAIAEVHEKGFSSMKMENIASRLGISRATLYLYFKNREELVAESHNYIRAQVSEVIREALVKDNLEESFSAIFDEFIYPEDRMQMNVILEIFASAVRNDELNSVVKNNYRTIQDVIAGILKEQQAAGTISEDLEIPLAVGTIQALILGIKMGSVAGLEREDARRIWRTAIRKILVSRD